MSKPHRVLITGASSGIGKATAYAFAETGSALFLVARRKNQLTEVGNKCYLKGARQVCCQVHDLSVPGQGTVIVQNCLQELGGLEVLICNAGYGIYGPVSEILPKDMERIWQVNFQSGYESIHTALPYLLNRKEAHIILISSIIGKKALPYIAPYCVTKAAQVSLGNALWAELKKKGVHVSVICPGFTATEFQEKAKKTSAARNIHRFGGGQSPKIVARSILQAIDKKHREVHLTLVGKIFCFMERLSPSITSWLTYWFIDRHYK